MTQKQKEPIGKVNNNSKKLGISALAMIDNVVYSKTEKWAYYRLSNHVFDFISLESKVALASRLTNAFSNLMNDKQEPVECHIIITSVPIDLNSWSDQVKTISKSWDRAPNFDTYIKEQKEFLEREEYMIKAVYLGINLGKRGALEVENINIIESGLKGARDYIKSWWNNILYLPTEEVKEDEEKEVRRKEENIYRILSTGNLQAERCTSQELLLLIKRQFYPALPTPYLDIDHSNRIGPGDIALESHSMIKNKYRWLEFSHIMNGEEYTTYRTCLSFSKFPKETVYPYSIPFLYLPYQLHLPFTVYARFFLIPTSKMKAEIEKKKKEQKDEVENISAGMDDYSSVVDGAPTGVIESLSTIQEMSEMVNTDKTPWVEGSYRIVVETPSEELLRKYCSILKQQFADQDINVSWTSGDQTQLFLEQMPGDKLRVKSFNQLTNLNMITTSGFNFSNDVGDLISANRRVR